mgnify:CR=1 FL=1
MAGVRIAVGPHRQMRQRVGGAVGAAPSRRKHVGLGPGNRAGALAVVRCIGAAVKAEAHATTGTLQMRCRSLAMLPNERGYQTSTNNCGHNMETRLA